LANLSLSLEIVLFTFVIVKPLINMKKTIHLVGALVAVGLQACKSVQQKNIDLTVKPGAIWQDTNQEVINAHGGGLLKEVKTTTGTAKFVVNQPQKAYQFIAQKTWFIGKIRSRFG
jgi:hypothetical protein